MSEFRQCRDRATPYVDSLSRRIFSSPARMKRLLKFGETSATLRQFALWTLLALPVGLLAGSASALFLWSLDRVTQTRWDHPRLLWLLPAAGFSVGWLYLRIGGRAEGGTPLILDQIHRPGGGVPGRMAPLVLVGTLITHLCGGSAGREGTAVQMGGSLAGALGRFLRLKPDDIRVLLMAGVAAGFGSVFGTPLAGAVFALEVLVLGWTHRGALLPVLVASLVGDVTCTAWGIHHANYHIAIGDNSGLHAVINPTLLAKISLAALAFGLVARGFAEINHAAQRVFKRFIAYAPLRPVVGGLIVIALVGLTGTRDYLGIGVTSPDPAANTLLSAFQPGGATTWSWAWKLLFTVVTLASGFKGGEVTPLFFIGATLGHTLALLLGAPVDLLAGLGLVAVFAGATKTPLACTLMGLELFGGHCAVYFAIACWVAHYVSGSTSIYKSPAKAE